MEGAEEEVIAPDEKTLQAMSRLANSTDYQVLAKWLEANRADIREQNDYLCDAPGRPALSQNQGRSQCITDILNMVTDARGILEKTKK